MNEWYAKDNSRKIRAVIRAKAEDGKSINSNIPYGYMKSKDDKYQWILQRLEYVGHTVNFKT